MKHLKIARKLISRTAIALAIIVMAYVIPILLPDVFFQSSVSYANLTLSSDRNFAPGTGREVLQKVDAKLRASPLYVPEQQHSIYITNSNWRRRLFFSHVYGVGGVNYFPLTTNVFLSGAVIEDNKLISPSGRIVEGARSLDYFVAHEISHTLLKQKVGILNHERLPEYIREGLPDYIAMGKAFDYSLALSDFLAEAPAMDREKSGLYYRYHFLVAYLMQQKGWTEDRLMQTPPDQGDVEKEIRARY